MKYGGHELAAGLSIERANLAAFKKKINDYAREILTPQMLQKSITLDCEIRKEDVNFKTMDEINLLEPYGCANPVPLFCFSGATILSITSLADNKHTKLFLQNGDMTINALYFGMPASMLKYFAGDKIDIACNLDVNNFQNQKQLQFIVRDIRLSSSLNEYFAYKKQVYIQCEKDISLPINQSVVPSRDDFKEVYQALCRLTQSEGETVDLTCLCRMLSQKKPRRFDLHKLFIIIDVLDELGIITARPDDDEKIELKKITINPYTSKTALDSSAKLRLLKSRVSDTIIE